MIDRETEIISICKGRLISKLKGFSDNLPNDADLGKIMRMWINDNYKLNNNPKRK